MSARICARSRGAGAGNINVSAKTSTKTSTKYASPKRQQRALANANHICITEFLDLRYFDKEPRGHGNVTVFFSLLLLLENEEALEIFKPKAHPKSNGLARVTRKELYMCLCAFVCM
jgi:hypothetical protein